MKKNKFLSRVNHSFHSYKMSYTMFLLGLSAALSILGNIYGMLFLVLALLPIIAWVLLSNNDRENTDL